MIALLQPRQPGSIYSKLRVIGIPHDVLTPFLSDISKWIENSGEEWTVRRLKDVKNDIIQVRGGNPATSKYISRKGNIFKGSLGILQKWMMQSTAAFNKGIQALQVYSLFYANHITDLQEKKFLDAVLSEPTPLDSEDIDRVLKNAYSLLPFQPYLSRLQDPKAIHLVIPSSEKKAPLPDGTSVPEDQGLVDSLRFLTCSDANLDLYRRYYHLFRPVCGPVAEWMFNPNYNSAVYESEFLELTDGKLPLVGRIGFIQEAGYKLRSIANPGRVFQRVLEPLGNFLYDKIKTLPWDATFDQSKPLQPISDHLKSGQTVTCFDLSNATDLFPLHIQLKILEHLLPNNMDHINLFKEISNGLWLYGPKKRTIQWRVGQPLGLYPSFACFALAHGIILLGLLNKPYNGEFYILGDDVVILDDSLAKLYLQFMESIGCKISLQKSIRSNVLAEFAGKLISKDSVLIQMKHRHISDDSFIDLAKQLGPNSIPIFKPLQRKVLERLAPIPDFLGGLGWNPKGLELSKRLDFILEERNPDPLLTDYTSYVVRNFLRSSLYNNFVAKRKVNQISFLHDYALDQKAISLSEQILKGLSNLLSAVGKNISYVFEDSSLKIMTNSDTLRNRHTTLRVMMKRLGIPAQATG